MGDCPSESSSSSPCSERESPNESSIVTVILVCPQLPERSLSGRTENLRPLGIFGKSYKSTHRTVGLLFFFTPFFRINHIVLSVLEGRLVGVSSTVVVEKNRLRLAPHSQHGTIDRKSPISRLPSTASINRCNRINNLTILTDLAGSRSCWSLIVSCRGRSSRLAVGCGISFA